LYRILDERTDLAGAKGLFENNQSALPGNTTVGCDPKRVLPSYERIFCSSPPSGTRSELRRTIRVGGTIMALGFTGSDPCQSASMILIASASGFPVTIRDGPTVE
jgi:hypothetical protein